MPDTVRHSLHLRVSLLLGLRCISLSCPRPKNGNRTGGINPRPPPSRSALVAISRLMALLQRGASPVWQLQASSLDLSDGQKRFGLLPVLLRYWRLVSCHGRTLSLAFAKVLTFIFFSRA